MNTSNDWCAESVGRLEADFNRSADTHLFRLELLGFPGIELYFKDESTCPRRSLKHRLAPEQRSGIRRIDAAR